MTTPSASAPLAETSPSSPDVLMAGSWNGSTALTKRDLAGSCRFLRQVIGECLLQMEALDLSPEQECQSVRRELGRLNLMLAREDFHTCETARDTCRIVGSQLRRTLSVLDECAEAVRGAAYFRLSSLVDDWKMLEPSLRHFTARLEEFEGGAYSEDIVYTPIPYSFPEPRPGVAAVLTSWLSAMFFHAPARWQWTGVKL